MDNAFHLYSHAWVFVFECVSVSVYLRVLVHLYMCVSHWTTSFFRKLFVWTNAIIFSLPSWWIWMHLHILPYVNQYVINGSSCKCVHVQCPRTTQNIMATVRIILFNYTIQIFVLFLHKTAYEWGRIVSQLVCLTRERTVLGSIPSVCNTTFIIPLYLL